jgi:hypothetical protein
MPMGRCTQRFAAADFKRCSVSTDAESQLLSVMDCSGFAEFGLTVIYERSRAPFKGIRPKFASMSAPHNANSTQARGPKVVIIGSGCAFQSCFTSLPFYSLMQSGWTIVRNCAQASAWICQLYGASLNNYTFAVRLTEPVDIRET